MKKISLLFSLFTLTIASQIHCVGDFYTISENDGSPTNRMCYINPDNPNTLVEFKDLCLEIYESTFFEPTLRISRLPHTNYTTAQKISIDLEQFLSVEHARTNYGNLNILEEIAFVNNPDTTPKSRPINVTHQINNVELRNGNSILLVTLSPIAQERASILLIFEKHPVDQFFYLEKQINILNDEATIQGVNFLTDQNILRIACKIREQSYHFNIPMFFPKTLDLQDIPLSDDV
ncbi:TPA: hypothetical protein DEO28_02760 [Candidatus Dependentiae bacterium]|nr:MAG: hypothetical protein UR14_C0005G0096 [candidate division TM6 bacterium GW2011_GWE2_31_21]KKP53173.1 MAG: hypothetical protein UR43_C0007G0097 [candidate division TM6 bacterium GW2011_GWF2_33_332]HBS47992.1 hypothetical protein [Candidatus Dependentiae bacterium]HBZ73404.1 hypothetical protein [Candidatus Dependentiae bacterium]